MSAEISSAAESALLDGVAAILGSRRLTVDQNEIWLGLEPFEAQSILHHFGGAGARPNVEVISSADAEALGRRNRVGVREPTLLVIVEERWDARSQDFGQSLHDLSRKQVAQLLADSVRFPIENVWLERASDDATRSWIEALFDVLRAREARFAARDRDGQPMRLRLSAYFEYLALTPIAADQRADEALAEGLHRLRLFTHRALASETPARKQTKEALRERLAAAITQNYRASRDPDDFAAQLASRVATAESVLDRYLAKGGRLRVVPTDEAAARDAFREFLKGNVTDAVYAGVDWEFHEAATTRRGGKRRRHGVHGVLTDRDSMSEKRIRIVDAFVRKAPEGRQDEVKLDIEAKVDGLARSATAEAARTELRTRVHEAWSEVADLRERDQILGWIDTLFRRARSRDKQGIVAESLLEGLVEFARRAREDGTIEGAWHLVFELTGSTLSVDVTATAWVPDAHRYIRQSVDSLRQDGALDDSDGDLDSFTVPITVRAGGFSERLALTVPSYADDPGRLHHIRRPRLIVADDALSDGAGQDGSSGDAPARLPSLDLAKTSLRISERTHALAQLIEQLVTQLHPAGPFVGDDLRTLVTGYVELLETLPGSVDPKLAQRREELEAKKRTLVRRTPEYNEVLAEIEDLDEQIGESGTKPIENDELREIARFQTLLPAYVEEPRLATHGPDVAWLMPFHPLVVRARLVEDDLRLRVLRGLADRTRSFSERQLGFLQDALEELSPLEPCRVFAPWTAATRWPSLAFQGFEEGFARFERARATRDAVGKATILRALRDYVDVYPTSKDRLVVYLEADEDGRLASDLLTGPIAPSDRKSA